MYIISHKHVFITYHTCIYIYMKHHVQTIHDIKCIMDQIVYRIHYIYIYHMFYESNILYITYIIITC